MDLGVKLHTLLGFDSHLLGDFLSATIDAPPILSILGGRVFVHVVRMKIELLQDTLCERLVVPSGAAIQGQPLLFENRSKFLLSSCLEPLNGVEIVARTERQGIVIVACRVCFSPFNFILLASGKL